MSPIERHYQAYGFNLRTTVSLDRFLIPGVEPADLEYVVSYGRQPPALDRSELIGESVNVDSFGSPKLTVWCRADQYWFHYSGVGVYEIKPDSIFCYPDRDVLPEDLTNMLMGDIFSIWLELKGLPVLHASSVVVDGRAIGLLSHSGHGKSTLAATLVQVGCPLLTDDLLALKFRGNGIWGHPGYPRMRLWQDEALHFLGHSRDLERVHPDSTKRWVNVDAAGFGQFCNIPQRLACLYLLTRRGAEESQDKVEISKVPLRDAVIELVRYSFDPFIVEGIGLQKKRMDLLTRLVREVPVRRAIYPSGFEHLVSVRDAILRDQSHWAGQHI